MYDGDDEIYDEVKQNARDQQHPPLLATQEIFPASYGAPKVALADLKQIPGLSKRQMELIDNKDDPGPHAGAARERRLDVIQRDISSIKRFLPRMDEVRGFVSTMPHDDDEDLIEALAMADRQLTKFIADVTSKLRSLEFEFELKKVVV